MKKFIIVFQILILISQSIYAADGQPSSQSTEASVSAPIIPARPTNHRLPDFHFIPPQKKQFEEAVKMTSQFSDSKGEKINVDVQYGRFGSTFGPEFEQTVYEAEVKANKKVEFILALDTTMEAAKIYKQRLAAVNREAIIITIPETEQKKYMERWSALDTGGLKELWWETKDVAGKLLHPVETLSKSAKIIKNQFVTPTKDDLYLLKASIGTTALTTGVLIFAVGVDPTFALSLALARMLIGGSTTAYRKTINNLFRADITHDLSSVSTLRQVMTRVGVMGYGLSQAYYAIGSHLSSNYGLTQQQILSNTITSGVIDTAASIERDRKLSEKASQRMILYTMIVGTILSTLSITGNVGPVLLDWGIIQVSGLQTVSVTMFSALLLSYKFFADRVEKAAQKSIREHLAERRRRLLAFQELRKQREEQEAKARIEANERRAKLRQNMVELLEEARKQRGQHFFRSVTSPSPTTRVSESYAAAICSSLFR